MAENDSINYRPIEGFPGYRVGDDGSVWSLWRTCPKGRFLSDRWRELKASVQKSRTVGRAYRYLNLSQDGKPTTFQVHRLVLEIFVGLRPDGMECRHLDGNPANNRLDNLLWGLPEENRQDNRKHNVYGRGSTHSRAKLTEADVTTIRERYAAGGVLLRELAAQYGVNVPTVSGIVNRKVWKHI